MMRGLKKIFGTDGRKGIMMQPGMTDKELDAYADVVTAMKNLATAVDAFATVAKDEDKAGWLVGWLDQVEQDFLDFAMEFEGVDGLE